MIDFSRPGEVRNVDHAVKAFFEFDECTVAVRFRIVPLTCRPMVNFSWTLSHGVGFELAQSERYFLLFVVDPENDGFDSWSRLRISEGRLSVSSTRVPSRARGLQRRLRVQQTRRRAPLRLPFTFAVHRELARLIPWVRQLLLQAEATRSFSLLMSRTTTSSSCPTLSISVGCPKAPGHVGDVQQAVHAVEVNALTKSVRFFTVPSTGPLSFTALFSRSFWRFSLRSCSITSRRLSKQYDR